ncbi:sigma-70 family RNA polymerase sigma factor [Rhabdothermincola salaria]|uniref:sigma-70 family RNA polymerase sigma factor n=1 Tax=Rhabdothermincola salaria TaxID=2903142 RepID=UPI001E64FE9B|nr:sigma-70 family RNA polymerase sigma factor [Rhabdothermincola salaria]
MAAAREGDPRAMETLLRAHQPQVWALCRRLTGDDDDAADAAQEALIAIVRGLPRFDGRSALSTWVYRVATNAAVDELRRKRRRPLLRPAQTAHGGDPDDDAWDRPRDDSPDLDHRVSDRLDLDAALAQLPEAFRVPVVLRDVLGLDYAQIAQVLDLPAGTVRSRIARGRAALARTLRPTGDTDHGNQETGVDVEQDDHR